MKEKSRAKSLISEYFIFVIFIALVVVLTCLKPSFIYQRHSGIRHDVRHHRGRL